MCAKGGVEGWSVWKGGMCVRVVCVDGWCVCVCVEGWSVWKGGVCGKVGCKVVCV